MPPPETVAGRLAVAGTITIALAAIALALLRATFVANGFSEHGVAASIWFVSVLAHDAAPTATVLAVCALTLVVVRPWLRASLAVIAITIVTLMLADVAVQYQLFQRLYFTDLVKFRKELSALGSLISVHASSGPGLAVLLIGSVVLLSMLAALLPQRRRYRRSASVLASVSLLCFVVFLARAQLAVRNTFPDHTMNLFEVNAALTVDQPYSQGFVERLRGSPQPEQVCTPGLGLQVDVILVIIESLSMYQSRLMSSGPDMLPALDRLAESSTWFDGFIANGFTTDQGLIAFLTGRDPTPAFGRYASMDAYHGFAGSAGTLPERLARHDYHVGFLANSDLSFLDKGGWLKSLGFGVVEGHDHPHYDGAPRSHFHSAPDGLLFDRALMWLNEQPPGKPVALVLATTSSHPRFTHPITFERSEQAVFGYVDEVTAGFASQLNERGFFDNGLLLITSDHRAMTPLRRHEAQLFGESALARIPLIAVGRHPLPLGRRTGLFQQTDMPASLEHLIAESEVCRPAHNGLLFADPPVPPTQIVHARGDRRNQVDVYSAGSRHALRLAGDRSDWIGQAPVDAESIAARVHLERAERGGLDDGHLILDYFIRHRVPGADSGSGANNH